MSDYVRVYNLSVKDSLPTGNSGKVIKGTELDTELNAVAAAISSKADTNGPTFTGTPVAPTATFGTSTTQLATTAFVQAALQAMYPVGSVYINATVSTNPATLLGFGTWVTVGDGKVLVNQDTADTDFNTLGETGGSKSSVSSHTHTFSGSTGAMSANNTHNHVGTTDGVGDHSHYGGSGGSSGPYGGWDSGSSNQVHPTWPAGAHSHTFTTDTRDINHVHAYSGTTASTGSSNGNLQPYCVVRMWKRTA